jgi:hypothetical protein
MKRKKQLRKMVSDSLLEGRIWSEVPLGGSSVATGVKARVTLKDEVGEQRWGNGVTCVYVGDLTQWK